MFKNLARASVVTSAAIHALAAPITEHSTSIGPCRGVPAFARLP